MTIGATTRHASPVRPVFLYSLPATPDSAFGIAKGGENCSGPLEHREFQQ
jgi:hypothetical protein